MAFENLISLIPTDAPVVAAETISLLDENRTVASVLTDGNQKTLPIPEDNSEDETIIPTVSLETLVSNIEIRGGLFSLGLPDGSPENTFKFSLLPAIESNIAPSVRGTTVPEVKPGILVRTDMNYKRHLIPGGHPAYQSLGVEQIILQLVGALIGDETTGGHPQNALSTTASLSAYRSSKRLLDLIKRGSILRMILQSESVGPDPSINMTLKVLVSSIRLLHARSDRTYYAIDALVLNDTPLYSGPATPVIGPPNPGEETPSTTVEGGEAVQGSTEAGTRTESPATDSKELTETFPNKDAKPETAVEVERPLTTLNKPPVLNVKPSTAAPSVAN